MPKKKVVKKKKTVVKTSKKVKVKSPAKKKVKALKKVTKKKVAKKTLKKINKKTVKPVKKKKISKSKAIKNIAKKIVRKISKKSQAKSAKKTAASVKKIGLKKALHNPIIKPRSYQWESKATFNPTAFHSNNQVHIVYRAIGEDDSSVLGYASSFDGLNITDRPTYLIYKRFFQYLPSDEPLFYSSGGGWSGGCEDPRITVIGDTIYMIYTAFDGWGSVRMALTSIKLDDFNKRKWHWKKPVFISAPGEIHKNWVLFPEKINGKFAILHSLSPDISIEYIDDLDEFDGTKFIKSYYNNKPNWKNSWDVWVRGVGPAPIKTNLGWLVLYHAMDKNDPNKYKLGAMILDPKDPTKILHHADHPILEPVEHYENEGHKWGVIYSCGAVVKDGNLMVYYGGADKFVCVASIPLEDLLKGIKKGQVIKLKN